MILTQEHRTYRKEMLLMTTVIIFFIVLYSLTKHSLMPYLSVSTGGLNYFIHEANEGQEAKRFGRSLPGS